MVGNINVLKVGDNDLIYYLDDSGIIKVVNKDLVGSPNNGIIFNLLPQCDQEGNTTMLFKDFELVHLEIGNAL
jgi:hypothetical protein